MCCSESETDGEPAEKVVHALLPYDASDEESAEEENAFSRVLKRASPCYTALAYESSMDPLDGEPTEKRPSEECKSEEIPQSQMIAETLCSSPNKENSHTRTVDSLIIIS